MSNVAKNIKNFRTFRGLSQQELGNMVGRTFNVISNWEIGKNSPDPDSIELICKALDVTPNELFGWSENTEFLEYLSKKEKITLEIDKISKIKKTLDEQLMMYYDELEKIKKHSD